MENKIGSRIKKCIKIQNLNNFCRRMGEWRWLNSLGSWLSRLSTLKFIKKLLSCASDGLVRLYSFTSPFKSPSAPTHVYKEKQCIEPLILVLSTTVRWVSSNTFLSGCSGVGRAMLWDLNGKVCAKYVYENGKGK